MIKIVCKGIIPRLIIKIYIFVVLFSLFLISNYLLVFADNKNKKDYVRVVAVGDVMLGREINNQILARGTNWPFESILYLLKNTDILFCNAEFSCLDISSPVSKEYLLGASTTAIKSLQCAGFDIVSLANNHTLDYGSKGLVSLMDELGKLEIMYIGAGRNYLEAQYPKMIEKKGEKICFLAYSLFSQDKIIIDKTSPTLTAFSEEKMKEDIQIAEKSGVFTVVSFHWGIEYSSSPTQYQKELAHLAVDCGADLIIGHHSRVIQGIENYKNAIILYSLGNFIFDGKDEKTKQGLLFECLISSNIIQQASILPIYIKEFRPMTLDLDYSYKIAKEIQALSEEFNTLITCKKGIIYIINRNKQEK